MGQVHRSAKELRWAIGSMARSYVRHALQCKLHRAQANEAEPPLDQWPSRENEPDPEGCDRQALSLGDPRSAQRASPDLPDGL